jgi:hypothetical protein
LLLDEVTTEDAAKLLEEQEPIFVTLFSTPEPELRIGIGHLMENPSKKATVSCNLDCVADSQMLSESPLKTTITQVAKTWLTSCRYEHVQCCRRWSSENPTRLLQIISNPVLNLEPEDIMVEMILGRGEKKDYVALSYCWGPTCSITQNGRTTTENVQSRMQPFSCSTFPPTIQDAIVLTKLLDIDYIWIDSVCIVQEGDDGKDWRQEAPKMHEIYGNALLTLCVCSNDRATERLIANRKAWSYPLRRCKMSDQYISAVNMTLDEMRARSPLSRRGWTLQEELLSSRILYRSGQSIFWSCTQGQHREVDVKWTASVRSGDGLSTVSRISSPQDFLLCCWDLPSHDALHKAWQDIVKSYCSRGLSKEQDRFSAISGLAARYQDAHRNDQYLAGLWKNSFIEDLAWAVSSGKPVDKSQNLYSIAPSWSWASLPFFTSITNSLDKCINKPSDSHVKLSQILFRNVSNANTGPPMLESIDERSQHEEQTKNASVAVGELVSGVRIHARLRPFVGKDSRRLHWSRVDVSKGEFPTFLFAERPEQSVHSADSKRGYVVAYEARRREAFGQIDYKQDVARFEQDEIEIYCLELRISTMLLLKKCEAGDITSPSESHLQFCRIGISYDYREDFFDGVKLVDLTLL